MASMEDLDANPFFRSLQTVFKSKFDEAQKRRWIVCIPKSASIRGVKITGQFVDTHILKPSPYLKSHFVTTDKNNNKTLQVDGNTIKILTDNSGKYEQSEVNIIAEELSYNKDYQTFKLYILDQPLDCSQSQKHDKSTSNGPFNQNHNGTEKDQILTLQQCKKFLQAIPSSLEILENLDKAIYKFNKNYMILPNYLHDASNRLKDIINCATENYLELDLFSLEESDNLGKDLKQAVENYVLSQVHSKVFSVIREKFSYEDKLLSRRVLELYQLGLTADQLGVKEEFCCPISSAVVELASLNGKLSPVEKLNCLKTTLELIPDDIYSSYKERDVPFKKYGNIPTLTSDDLIPLLVTVFVQARIQNLESNLYYIQNFSWNVSSRDKLSFSLVTFQAAKEFIRSHDFSHIKPSSKKIKKEMSLEELMNVTVQIQMEAKSTHFEDISKDRLPIDRHMQRVTQMIEKSTRDVNINPHPIDDISSAFAFKPMSNTKEEFCASNSGNEGLGDFLLNLQANSLGSTYGRQS